MAKKLPALYHKTYMLRPIIEGSPVMKGPATETEVPAEVRGLLEAKGVDFVIILTHAEHDATETRALLYRKMVPQDASPLTL